MHCKIFTLFQVVEWHVTQYYWESLCDIRPDYNHHFDASRTDVNFDELAREKTCVKYVRLAKY